MTAAAEPLTLVGEIDCLLDKLTSLDLTVLAGDELLEFTREWERLKHRGATVDHAVVAELDGRQTAGEKSLSCTAALLTQLLRLDPGQAARRRVADAADFGPRRGLTGEPVDPIHRQTARALAEGAISIEHARSVAELFGHIPAQTVEGEAAIETAALHAAAMCTPHQFRQWCVQAAARLDHDGQPPSEEVTQRRRGVSVHDRPDGTARLTGVLTAGAAAALRAVLGPPVRTQPRRRRHHRPAQRRPAASRRPRGGVRPAAALGHPARVRRGTHHRAGHHRLPRPTPPLAPPPAQRPAQPGRGHRHRHRRRRPCQRLRRQRLRPRRCR